MKKRMILALAALLIFGLSIATFAYKQTTATNKAASCSCCKGDSCPVKNKAEKTGAVNADLQNVTVAMSSESCDCSCCNHNKSN